MKDIIDRLTDIAKTAEALEIQRKAKLEKSLARTNSLLARHSSRVRGEDREKLKASMAEVKKFYPDIQWTVSNGWSARAIMTSGDYRVMAYWMSGGGVKVHVRNKFVDCVIITYGAKLKVQDLRLDATLTLGKSV